MDLMQIRGFHDIGGESRMPTTTEDGLFVKWDDALEVFVYTCIKGSDDETFLETVVQVVNDVTFTMNDGTIFTIDLGLSDIDLGLPGDTKILFDEADTIGGRAQFTYDYVNQRVKLTDSQGIYSVDTDFVSDDNILFHSGTGNVFLGNIDTKSPFALTALAEYNIGLGRNALASVQTQIVTDADKNVGIGYQAGYSTINSGSVFIGAYAGKLETLGDKFYLGNTDYATLQASKDESLLYGEFANGLLYVNNRLDVREEVKIGVFDISNTPTGGMVQFIDDADPTYVKPQYYDNTAWVDFANGLNYYLTTVTNVDTTWTFGMTGTADIVVVIPDTNYPSSATQYAVQLSNGDSTFIEDVKLTWLPSNDSLVIDGGLVLSPKVLGDFTPVAGLALNTGDHVYMYIDGEYKQLDNEPNDGQTNEGESIGDTVEVYAGMNIVNHNLQFYDLEGGTKINILGGDVDGNILFNVDYDVDGANSGATGVGWYIDTTNTANSSTLNFKKIYSSDASISITDVGTYIDITTIGAGGGEINDGENVGAGEGRIYDEVNGKNGLLLPYRTLKEGINITIATDTVTKMVTITSDALLVEGANIAGGDQGTYKDYIDDGLGNRTLNFKPLEGTDDILVTLNGDVIEIALDPTITISDLDGVILPVATNLDKTLTWSLTYDSNIRDATPAVLENIAQLNLGSNLVYTVGTNSLDALSGGDPLNSIENALIVRNGDGTVDRTSSNRNVIFTSDKGILKTWDGTTETLLGLGWLAFENDYPIASDTQPGIVEIDVSGPLSIVAGVLSSVGGAPGDPVYSIQYNDAGAFGGDAGLLYKPASDAVFLTDPNASGGAWFVFGSTVGDPSIYVSNDQDTMVINSDNSTISKMILTTPALGIGNSLPTTGFVSILDWNDTPKTNTLEILNIADDDLLLVQPDGSVLIPQMALLATATSVYIDITTGLLTYGPASINNGINTITTDALSGLWVNGADSSSSLSVTKIDQNDNRLVVATIDDEDFVGFWDVSAGVQSKTTLSNMLVSLGAGWDLDVNDVGGDTIAPGQTLNIDDSDNVEWTYNSTSNTLVATAVIPVTSVNGETGIIVLDTDNIDEGSTNLYYTEVRVSANTDVAANTAARHNPVTKVDTANIDLTLDVQELSADLTDTTVTPGSYTTADITVDAKGRITAAASGVVTPTIKEDMAFEFADVGTGITQYTLDIKASYGYTIINTILETDDSVSGTVSGGASTITYTNVGTLEEIATTSVVEIGDRIYLNVTAGHSATVIRGKLVIQRD